MNERRRHADKYVFIVCLVCSIGLFIGSFFVPPLGVIDPSVLKATGILFGFAALAVVGQNLANGKEVTFKKDDTEITISEDEETK